MLTIYIITQIVLSFFSIATCQEGMSIDNKNFVLKPYGTVLCVIILKINMNYLCLQVADHLNM